MAASKALYLGKYVITEKQAPHGMALQTEPHTVELVYAGQEVTVTELRADMYNERQRVEISLVKRSDATAWLKRPFEARTETEYGV